MGVRGPDPNHPLACLGSTVESTGSSDPVSPTVVPYPPSIANALGILTPAAALDRDSRSSINSSVEEHRPDDPRRLVGERNCHQHARLSRHHLLEPRSLGRTAPARVKNDGSAAEDQQAPQRSLAHPGDRTKSRLAAGRSLQWCETDPGGEVAALTEALWWRGP